MLLFRFLNRCHNLLRLPEVKLVLGSLALLTEPAGFWDLGAALLGLWERRVNTGSSGLLEEEEEDALVFVWRENMAMPHIRPAPTLQMILVLLFPYKGTRIPANEDGTSQVSPMKSAKLLMEPTPK